MDRWKLKGTKKKITIVAKNYTCIMYNYFRCLIVSTKIHKKLLMQESNRENILSLMINYYASSQHIWNNLVYKKFYCQIANNEKTNEISVMKNDAQQKLDEVLSNLEDLKRYQILELEIDVIRHGAGKVPEKLNPDDWLLLLKLPSKRQRM